MSGIAGIAAPGRRDDVARMLDRIAYRGPAGREIVETEGTTLGIVWTDPQCGASAWLQAGVAADQASNSRYARARAKNGNLTLERDPLGVAPLYYGTTAWGDLAFASEVKALLAVTGDVHELPPGHQYTDGHVRSQSRLEPLQSVEESPEQIARELRRRLGAAIERRLAAGPIGSWLSGGLDSSALAAIARRSLPATQSLHTFTAGLADSPDLKAARVVASYLGTEHHEIVVSLDDLLSALPEVIYHLESFDALLVRSSITNYLASQEAARHVTAVLSGEAADELFAGYAYLADCPPGELAAELIDITGRLHNTALQRVDRSASAHGTLAYVPFTDPDVVDYALRIPVAYKRRDGSEKWILRRAVDGALPESIVERRKAKFWEGAGVGDLLAGYAEGHITDAEFRRERNLPNGWKLHSKEEVLYYRIFREHFGAAGDLSWMGRTKGTAE